MALDDYLKSSIVAPSYFTSLSKIKRYINFSKDAHVPLAGTCEYITIHSKKKTTNFANMIKLNFLTWGGYPGLSLCVCSVVSNSLQPHGL